MKVLAIVIVSLTTFAGLQAEKVCESCILRQQSHKDDINNAPYYEDSGFFTIESIDGTPLAPEKKVPATQRNQGRATGPVRLVAPK